MKPIKTVGVKELKNNLSAYLRMIQAGYSVLITDRNKVVAELREPMAVGGLIPPNPLLALWIQEGKVKAPIRKKGIVYPPSPIKSKAGTASKLIEEEREES